MRLGFVLGAGYVLMVVIGLAGVIYGLRVLRPNVREIDQFLRAREREPSRYSGFFAGTSVFFGIFSLLIGLLFVMFGLTFMLLSD